MGGGGGGVGGEVGRSRGENEGRRVKESWKKGGEGKEGARRRNRDWGRGEIE